MPAESKAQHRLIGLAMHNPGKVSRKNRGILSMSRDDMEDYASTKEKGMPMHKRSLMMKHK